MPGTFYPATPLGYLIGRGTRTCVDIADRLFGSARPRTLTERQSCSRPKPWLAVVVWYGSEPDPQTRPSLVYSVSVSATSMPDTTTTGRGVA